MHLSHSLFRIQTPTAQPHMFLTVCRKSSGRFSSLQVDDNCSFGEVLQMAMFDIGSVDMTYSTLYIEIEGKRVYLALDQLLSSVQVPKGTPMNLIIEEHTTTDLTAVANKFREWTQNPETKRLGKLDKVYNDTFDEYPEMFMPLHMLFLRVIMNGIPVTCLVDTGAHNTCISKRTAMKCNLTEWIDPRVTGTAVGVGSAKIIGMVYNTNIIINEHAYPISLTVIDQESSGAVDFLFGLDMLRRHGCSIDLKRYELHFDDGNVVPFLSAEEAEKIEKR